MPKLLKSLKQVKGLSLLPKPFLNYVDPANNEFLQYAPQIPSLTAHPHSEVLTANHQEIAGLCEQFSQHPNLKDIALFGRSNVGKSSLLN